MEERYGLIFAYIGLPDKKPLLPHYGALEALVYEGTSELQAIDLMQRKWLDGRGEWRAALLAEFDAESHRCAADPALRVADDAWQGLGHSLLVCQRAAAGARHGVSQRLDAGRLRDHCCPAARLLGRDAGPMSDFDLEKVNETFFADCRRKANFLVNLGYGDPAGNHPRDPHLGFDDVARIE